MLHARIVINYTLGVRCENFFQGSAKGHQRFGERQVSPLMACGLNSRQSSISIIIFWLYFGEAV